MTAAARPCAARARPCERFAEIFVDTPLEVCAARDPKGLYKAAKSLPGVQAPYEPPLAPELVVHGEDTSPRDNATKILSFIERRGWI